jgi:hypothetical protein
MILSITYSSIIPEGKHTKESRTFFGRTKLSYRLSLEPIHWDGDGSTPIISISRGIHIHKPSILGYPGWVLTHTYIITATSPWPCGYTARLNALRLPMFTGRWAPLRVDLVPSQCGPLEISMAMTQGPIYWRYLPYIRST